RPNANFFVGCFHRWFKPTPASRWLERSSRGMLWELDPRWTVLRVSVDPTSARRPLGAFRTASSVGPAGLGALPAHFGPPGFFASDDRQRGKAYFCCWNKTTWRVGALQCFRG